MALLLAAVASLIGLVIASSVQSPALSGIFTVLSIVFFAGFVLLSIRLFRAAPPGQAMYSVGRAMWMVTSLTFWSVAVGLGILAIGYGAAVGAPGAGPILVYALAFVVIVLAGVSGAMQIVRRRRTLLILSNLEKATQLNLPLQRMILAAAQSEKGVLQARLMALHEHLDRGEPLHQALVNAVPDMPYNVVRVIAAGERMGCLPHVLGGLIRSRTSRYGPFVQTAGPYRCYLAVFIAVAWLILTVVIPKFQGIMNDFKISMPQSTRLLVAVSPESVLWAILLTLLALAPLARALEKVFPSFRTISPFGGAMGDQILWWMPVTGGFVRDRGTAELCDLVAVGVEMGHPVDESIREAAAAQPNAVMRYRTTAWADAVTRGQPLHEAARFARMPDLFVSMLATVRDSDGLLQVLGFLWRYYEYRFVRTRAILQAAYVPVIVFLMGAMVAILGLSIIQPLTSMMDHLARHVSGGF
jgi:type II secretory pathway component PulF